MKLVLVSCLSILWLSLSIADDSSKEKLTAAKAATDEALKKIFDRWQIAHYPNFLQSVAMTHTSWEVLKVRDS